MKRKEGFYWVKINETGWIIAEFDSNSWVLCGTDFFYSDHDFIQIDENRIIRKQ